MRVERGTLIAGKYELRERLGRGGMGEVWAGRDRDLHRNVAIKLLVRDDDASPDLLHRFEREAVAAAQINHPNVVSLYDRGVHDGLQFLVMEHIDGTTLARHMHERAPMAPERALEIVQEICAALVAAHRAKVVHYDIKPSNVMLTADNRVKVVDFGIAGFTHTHTFTVVPTSMLSPVGTALYGAPEQFLDQRGDERSDLYALGGVLFALLTGKPPFGDGSPLSIIRRKLDDRPPLLSSVRPDAPEPVTRLLSDLLHRDPDRRPQTASALYERLERLRSTPTGVAARVPDGGPPTRPFSPETETRDAEEEAFEIAWTGREPVSAYVTHEGPPLARHRLLLAVLALPVLFAAVVMTANLDAPRSPGEDYVLILLGSGSLCALVLLVLYGRKVGAATLSWRRHRRAGDRRPWSLRVDAGGITTTDPRHATPGGPAGRRRYGWSLAAAVTLERAAEVPWGPTYTALHIQPKDTGTEGANIDSISPAGMARPRSPQGKAGRRPLCALGPMTEEQHQALIAALARHAGPRWKPSLPDYWDTWDA
jgi:hypothetical protein